MAGRQADVGVSVVLPCRNAAPYLATQLEALARQRYPEPWELVVSDNGCTDQSLTVVEGLRHRFHRVVLVDSSSTPGPGAARNAGVRAASADRILFCDADDQVGDGWLAAMADALKKHDLVAAAIDHTLLNTRPDLRPAREPGLLMGSRPFLPFTTGGTLGVRRSVHELVGGFDESYRDAYEDCDYCFRAQLDGFSLAFVPEAVVHYRHRERLLDIFRQSRAYSRGNVQLYRNFRQLGLTRPSPSRALVSWALLPIRLLPALTSRRRLVHWVTRAGWRVGRLQGCLRHRVWAP